MPRSLYQNTIMVKGPAGAIPLAGAAVTFRDPVDGLPIAYPLYADGVSLTPLTLPYVTGVLGELEVWADLPHRVRIEVVKSGLLQATETIDLEYPPEYSATTEDVASGIAAHEAKENPHPQYATDEDLSNHATDPASHSQYLTQDEGDDRYLGIGYVPDLTDYYTKGEADTAFLDQGEGDLRYEQLTRKGMASGYVPLGADTKIPNAYLPDLAITNTFVVTSQAEMLALTAQTGDVAVRLDTTENYILAAEPATVLANWTKLAASTTAGNTTIVKREEFAPAAASTSVALAAVPTQMLSVSRNGVEQSQPAGHYTVAGVTVTFTDAFVAGERVSVVYEVGSSAPAPINGYTKVESDARYEPIDTMYTKAESDARYLQPSVAASTYLPLAGGTITGDLIRNGADLTDRLIRWQTAGQDRWRLGVKDAQADVLGSSGSDFVLSAYEEFTANWYETIRFDRHTQESHFQQAMWLERASATQPGLRLRVGSNTQDRFQARMDGNLYWGSGTATADTTLYRSGVGLLSLDGSFLPSADNTRDLGTAALRWRAFYLSNTIFGVYSNGLQNGYAGMVTGDTQYRFQINSSGTHTWGGGTAAGDATLQRTGVGALRVDSYLGVGVNPEAWGAGYPAIRLGQRAAVWADSAGSSLWLSDNLYFNGTNRISILNAGVSQIAVSGGTVTFSAGPGPGAAGAAISGTHMPVRAQIGTTGTLSLTPDAGATGLTVPSIDHAYGDGRGIGAQWGTFPVAGGANRRIPQQGMTVLHDATMGSVQFWSHPAGYNPMFTFRSPVDGRIFTQIDSTGRLVAYCDDGVGFDLRNTANQNILQFYYTGAVPTIYEPSAASALRIYAGATSYIEMGSNNVSHWRFWYDGHLLPTGNGAENVGSSGNRVATYYGVTGTIQTSSAAAKEAITPLDPAACYQAAKDVRWYDYHYRPPVYADPPETPETKGQSPEARQHQVDEARAMHAKGVVESAPARHQRGFVFPTAEARDELGGALPPVPDLFGLDDRESATPQADLATLGAALQELIRRFEIVEGKVV